MARKRATSGSSGYTILVVDDQAEILTAAELLLGREGHRVLTANSGEEALALFRPHQIDLVIVDYFMPGMSGEEVIQHLRKQDENVQILLQTGYSGEKPPRDMLRLLDIQGYHDKSEGPERLLLWVDVALKAAAQLKKVQETEQLKSELLANVSHELRTPLHIILGYTEYLLNEHHSSLPPECQKTIEGIWRYASALWDLIHNFLDLAKIEAGGMEVVARDVQLQDFREEIEDLMKILLQHKPVSFAWQVHPQLPPVWADQKQLRVILRNLLTNAAKFTEQGEIRVLGRFTESGDEITLAIQDTGVGIDPAHHELIFELFRQEDSSSTRRFGGTGLGLALAHRLTLLLGGQLSVESRPGMGATFTLTLKAAPASSPSPEPPSLA